MKRKLIIGSVILFIIALGFNIFFNTTSLDKLYIDTLFSRYFIIAKNLQKNIEKGFFGFGIRHISSIEKILPELVDQVIKDAINFEKAISGSTFITNDEIADIYIADLNGNILFSNSKKNDFEKIPEKMLKSGFSTGEEKDKKSIISIKKYDNSYYRTLPIKDASQKNIGIIILLLNEDKISSICSDNFAKSIYPIIIIGSFGVVLLIILLNVLVPDADNYRAYSKFRISTAIFSICVLSLVIICCYTTYDFVQYFLASSKNNSLMINSQLSRTIEHFLNSGARIDKLANLDVEMRNIIIDIRETEDITLFDHTGQPLYRASKNESTDFQRSKNAYTAWIAANKPLEYPEFNVKTDIFSNDKYMGYLSTNISKNILTQKLIDNILDAVTVIIISILFFVEMLILIFKYFERQFINNFNQQSIDYSLMRPAAFLLLFGIDISVSFLPLHMEFLYCPILNFSKEAIMGLPISVEFLFVGISILISGIWIDKKGWAPPFIIGTILALCGIIYSAIAPDAQHFIVSRAIVGSGYGLSLMAAQGFVIRFTDWKTKAQGLASLFAGIYAGSICGTATGGMLSEWMDYRNVFLIGGCIMILVIIYLILFMRSAIENRKKITIQEKKEKKNLLAFSRFLFNRTILSLIFFSSLPAAIAVVGFLNYFTPIYLNRIGASQSTIGQIIMLYGICLIYLGPVISRYVDTSNNKKVYIMMGSLIGSLALISFYFLSGLYASIVAIVLLGISSSLVLASQSVYALKLKVTKELGEGKAIGIFRSTSRVGQMIGPIVFSSVIALSNINFGITILGVVYVLSAILFLIFTQSDMKTLIVEES